MTQKGRLLEKLGIAAAGAALIGSVYIASVSKKDYSRAIQPVQQIDVTEDGINDAIVKYVPNVDVLTGPSSESVYAIDGTHVFQDEQGKWRTNTQDYIILHAVGGLENIQGLVFTPKKRFERDLPLNASFYNSPDGRFKSFKLVEEGEGDARRLAFEFELDDVGTPGIPGKYKLKDVRPFAVSDFYTHSESFRKPKKEVIK